MRKSAILSVLAAMVMLAACGPEEVSSNGNGSGGGNNTPEPVKVTEISVAQDKINVTSAGGSFTVQVTSNATLSVSVSSDWVHQSGSGYSFTADHNPGYDPRSCTITFSADGKSKSVTVTQAQQDAIIPGETQYELFYEAQTFTLPVSTNVDLTVAPTVSWIKSQDTRALSQKNFSFSIEENSSKEPREGIIEITSGSLRQSIKVVQLPTTHLPQTEDEMMETIKLAESISAQSKIIIDNAKKASGTEIADAETVASRMRELDGVISAEPSLDGGTVVVMQRDSLYVNILLNTTDSYHDHENESPKSSASTRSTVGNMVIPDGKDALILAPFQSSFNKPLEDYKSYLNGMGYTVQVFEDDKADISKFDGEYLEQFDVVIIDTHGGHHVRNLTSVDFTSVSSGTRFTSETSIEELWYSIKNKDFSPADSKQLYNDYFVVGIDGKNYLAASNLNLHSARFEDKFVFLSACETATDITGNGSLMKAIKDRGAGAVLGYNISIPTTQNNVITQCLFSCLEIGLSLEEAILLSKHVLGDDYVNPLITLPSNPASFYLFDPRPGSPNPKVVGNNVTLTWATPKSGISSHLGESYYSYDIYIDDKLAGSSVKPLYTIKGLTSGSHDIYVVTHLVLNNEKVKSFKGEVGSFEIEAPEVPAIKVTGVKVTPGTVTLEEGMSVELTATITPTDATNQKVIWSSDHPEFATVDQTGVVTAVAANGSTRVYVTATTEDGNKTARCRIYVKEATGDRVPVTGINIVQSDVELEVGKTSELRAGIIPSNATNKSVQWTSSDPSVVTVTDGVLVAKGEGTATITAKTVDGGFTASVSVTVKKASEPQKVSVTAVSLNKSTLSLKVGESSTLRATISPSDATDKGVIWTSNRTSVATVSSSGVVTGKAAGTAVITVRTNDGGKTSTCNVTVTSNPEPGGEINVSQISISPSSATLAVGGTRQFSVTITPANATNQEVSWSSSNTSVASVNSEGLVTAKAEGQATITVTSKDGGFSSKATVTVSSESQEPGSYSLSPNPLDFGDVKVGSESTNRVMIRNTGKRPIQFSKVTSGDGVYLDMTVPFTLAVGEGRSFKVTFVPSEVRKYWVLISFTTDADNEAELLVQGNSTGQSGYSVTTPEAVDLGLSVKWASFNVGATKPEGYGDYFAWGETKPKSTYTWTTYTLAKGSHTSLTKYCTDESYGYNGFTDGKKRLDSSDDAATASLGKGWRMPTVSELEELKRNCERTWTTVNGVVGCLLTSTINGNSIFIPQAGVRADSGNMSTSGGYCWTSDLDYDPYSAYNILFNENTLGYSAIARFCGLPIRAVYVD